MNMSAADLVLSTTSLYGSAVHGGLVGEVSLIKMSSLAESSLAELSIISSNMYPRMSHVQTI